MRQNGAMVRRRILLVLVLATGLLAGIPNGDALGSQRVSLNSHGQPVPGGSHQPSMSADGRYVAFSTTARLTPDDKNSLSDVYVRDRVEKTTHRVTDERGGDQPAISANGRFVAFRALDGTTRIRVVDLEHPGAPVAAAIPTNVTNYNRPSDSAVISPDGRYVGYAFRPSPLLVAPTDDTRGHQVMVTDLLTQFGPRVYPEEGGAQTSIPDLGRVAMSYDGELVVFETTAALTADDTNEGSDIYVARRTQPFASGVKRISVPGSGQPDTGTARDPVISQDGTRIFFISDDALSAADDDERATIYVASSANSFQTFTVAPLSTNAAPVAMAPQATLSGTALAFLGKPDGKPAKVVVRDLTFDTETIVPLGAVAPTAAPVLAGDGSLIAVSARGPDGEQVYTADVPAAVPGPEPRNAPNVTILTGLPPADEIEVVEGQSLSASIIASDPGGAIRLVKVEENGVELARKAGPSLGFSQTATRGVYEVQARAFNDVWIEGRTAPFRLIVKPVPNLVAITGARELTRSWPALDGRVDFQGVLRLDNTRSTASNPLRIILTEAPTTFIMSSGAASPTPLPAEENVLDVIELPPLAGQSSTLVPIMSHTSPAVTTQADGFKGLGWTVRALLREQVSGNYVNQGNPTDILQSAPKLNENTQLPNGGTPQTDGPGGDPNFNPALLQSISIQGRARLGGPSRASYAARAIFNNANKSCEPAWSLQNAGGVATISDTGVLSVGAIAAPRDIMVRAAFAGKEALLPVTVFPLPPQIIVRAGSSSLTEGGEAGEFRLKRFGNLAKDLIVNFAMEGTAVNGGDYTLVSSAATIPAGESSVSVPITPKQDVEVEGFETIKLRLLPDPSYRLLGARTATMRLEDDDPVKADQPDLTLRRGAGITMGALTYSAGDYAEEEKQTIEAKAVRNQRVTVQARVFNRGLAPQAFLFQGSPSSVGFSIKYSSGGADVTDAVVAGTFTLPLVDPGDAAGVSIVIVPTGDAPVGGAVECELKAFSTGGTSDLGEVRVTRVR